MTADNDPSRSDSGRIRYRSYDDKTADILNQRLTTTQLVQLVGDPKFGKFQEKILKRLENDDGLNAEDYEKVHNSERGCKVQEVTERKSVHLEGVDLDVGFWSREVERKHLKCTRHRPISNSFIWWNGQRRHDLVY